MRAHSKGCAKISSGKALPASLLMVPVASPSLITAAMGLLSTLKRVQVKAADADAQACDVPAVDNGVAPAATHLRAAIGGEELWASGLRQPRFIATTSTTPHARRAEAQFEPNQTTLAR